MRVIDIGGIRSVQVEGELNMGDAALEIDTPRSGDGVR